MRIAIDARELQGKPTGVGRYLSELLAVWKELPAAAAHDFILCAPAAYETGGTAWEQLTLPRLVRRARADVLFSPGYTAPIFSPAPNRRARPQRGERWRGGSPQPSRGGRRGSPHRATARWSRGPTAWAFSRTIPRRCRAPRKSVPRLPSGTSV